MKAEQSFPAQRSRQPMWKLEGIAQEAHRNSPPNFLSRSKIKYFGAVSSGNASRSCCTTHWLVGCSVVLKWRILLRPWLMMKKQ